ncbi:PKD domain-containing protein [Spirosoma sp.]|uniref:PKD domain-containing protein n=1 Tax=Spirosoma sp. TaxID=1899569 RepID=UPI00262DDFBE|nr:PKD domain-containing protein [Spirosoma sp.]MCX6219002.1 PKD domain-containing protein [Spirosoma sp.]
MTYCYFLRVNKCHLVVVLCSFLAIFGLVQCQPAKDTPAPSVPVLPVEADFSYSAEKYVTNTNIRFKNSSQNATIYVWDFGDGSVSGEAEPTHQYAQMGIYYITLTASDAQGNKKSLQKEVRINPQGNFQQSVVVVLDTTLVKDLHQSLNVWFNDMVNDGYRVVMHPRLEQQPIDLRKRIQTYFTDLTPRLEGVLFVGQTPIPSAQYIYPPSTPYRGLSMQFYMDLDGQFTNAGQPANMAIDAHTGRVETEIWTSILPFYQSKAQTIASIRDYLTKNHAYRTQVTQLQKGFIKPVLGSRITTEALYASQYKIIRDEYYTALAKRGNFYVGIDNTLGDLARFPTSQVSYEQEMLTNKYDVASIGAHGNTVSFGSFNEWGSILIDVNYARRAAIKPVFLLEHSCNTAAIDNTPNLGTEFLYNKANNVLIFAGATAPQGGMGQTALGRADQLEARLLTEGSSIGTAHFAPMTMPYTVENFKSFREAYSAQQIMLGDGTLRLQEFLKR